MFLFLIRIVQSKVRIWKGKYLIFNVDILIYNKEHLSNTKKEGCCQKIGCRPKNLIYSLSDGKKDEYVWLCTKNTNQIFFHFRRFSALLSVCLCICLSSVSVFICSTIFVVLPFFLLSFLYFYHLFISICSTLSFWVLFFLFFSFRHLVSFTFTSFFRLFIFFFYFYSPYSPLGQYFFIILLFFLQVHLSVSIFVAASLSVCLSVCLFVFCLIFVQWQIDVLAFLLAIIFTLTARGQSSCLCTHHLFA